MEGAETGNDAYRNPEHKQSSSKRRSAGNRAPRRTCPKLLVAAICLRSSARQRERPAGEKWAYTSSNTAVIGEVVSRVTGKSLADTISDLIWSKIGAEHDAIVTENERGYPVSGGGMAATLRDVARFGLLFTKNPPTVQPRVISDAIIKRYFSGYGDQTKPDEHGMLPLTYEWDVISDKGELAKGGWGGQLLYINREKDVVVAWFGTNQTANPNSSGFPAELSRTHFSNRPRQIGCSVRCLMGNCILYNNSTSPQAKFSTDVEKFVAESASSVETGINNSGPLKPTVEVTGYMPLLVWKLNS